MPDLPKYVSMRGNRYRVALSKKQLGTRYVGSYGTLEEAVRARDAKLRELGLRTPEEAGTPPDQPKMSFQVNGNTAEAHSEGLIHTLEGLIEAAEVDTETWRVLNWSAKAYAGWAKNEQTDLTYVDGTIDHGHVRRDGIITQQLWSVHARFVRREPVPVFPVVQPIACEVKFPPPHSPHSCAVARSVILADPHFWYRTETGRHSRRNVPAPGGLLPLHDNRALDVSLQVVEEVQPERVDILGDLLDMTDWTDRFTRSPPYQYQLQPTLLAAHSFLRALRERVPQAQIRLFEGNHEARLRTAILNHLPAAYDLQPVDEIELDLPPTLSVQRLLALHELQIEWVGDYPDGEAALNERVWLSHGESVSAVPGSAARKMMSGSVVTRIFGHIHRHELTAQTYWTPRRYEVRSYCPGCLCHLDGRVEGRKQKQNWQQGIALVEYQPAADRYRIESIPIDYESGSALWRGRLLVGREEQA